jgi:hypothetical protein
VAAAGAGPGCSGPLAVDDPFFHHELYLFYLVDIGRGVAFYDQDIGLEARFYTAHRVADAEDVGVDRGG